MFVVSYYITVIQWHHIQMLNWTWKEEILVCASPHPPRWNRMEKTSHGHKNSKIGNKRILVRTCITSQLQERKWFEAATTALPTFAELGDSGMPLWWVLRFPTQHKMPSARSLRVSLTCGQLGVCRSTAYWFGSGWSAGTFTAYFW